MLPPSHDLLRIWIMTHRRGAFRRIHNKGNVILQSNVLKEARNRSLFTIMIGRGFKPFIGRNEPDEAKRSRHNGHTNLHTPNRDNLTRRFTCPGPWD